MTGDSLEAVVESVQDWTGSRRGWDPGSGAQTGLVVSCSMHTCERGGALWPVDVDWAVRSVQTLGNQTWERCEGERTLCSDIEHLSAQDEIAAVLVVGHTSCAVLEDVYERWIEAETAVPAGLDARFDPLVSLVGEGFGERVLTESMPLRTVRYRLVEYNVRRQVQFLQQALPPSVTVAGYVHDQDGAYSSFPDKRYLVALDGETDPTTTRTRLPEDASVRVASLLR